MNSKEIEARSGVTRANIRFYEKEGLLSPSRQENGYRDYSEEDLAVLQRIVLLRQLGIPIEQIRRIQTGETGLDEALAQRLAQLGSDLKELQAARILCERLLEEHVDYRQLDARRYLEEADIPADRMAIRGDVIPRIRHPWRRYFARMLDLQIYMLLWLAFLYFAVGLHPIQNSFLQIVNGFIPFAMMLFIEPLLLSRFGYTAGKWIFGLTLTDSEGGRPEYSAAFARCWKVFRWGEGFNIPFYNLYRNYKCWLSCDAGEELPWEEGFAYTIRDTRPLRAVGYLMAYVLVVALSVFAELEAQMPKHRGEISAAEFAANYNDYRSYLRIGTGYTLHPDGSWSEPAGDYLIMIGPNRRPAYTIVETDGVVTQVGFEIELREADWIDDYNQEIELAVLSYLAAQPGMNWLRTREVMKRFEPADLKDISFSYGGIDVSCEVEYQGFERFGRGTLFPIEGDDHYFSLRFWMEKPDGLPA